MNYILVDDTTLGYGGANAFSKLKKVGKTLKKVGKTLNKVDETFGILDKVSEYSAAKRSSKISNIDKTSNLDTIKIDLASCHCTCDKLKTNFEGGDSSDKIITDLKDNNNDNLFEWCMIFSILIIFYITHKLFKKILPNIEIETNDDIELNKFYFKIRIILNIFFFMLLIIIGYLISKYYKDCYII